MIEKSIVPFYYFSPRCCVLSAEALFLAALPPHPFRRVSFIQSRDSGSQFRASTLKKRVNWEHNRIASTKYSKLVSLNSSLCYYDINISSQIYKIMSQTHLKSPSIPFHFVAKRHTYVDFECWNLVLVTIFFTTIFVYETLEHISLSFSHAHTNNIVFVTFNFAFVKTCTWNAPEHHQRYEDCDWCWYFHVVCVEMMICGVSNSKCQNIQIL